MTDKELQDFIKHGETGFVEFAMVFGDGWARHAIEIAKELRARLSQCERCGEVNPAEIHTCSPQEPVAWLHDRGDVVDLNVSGHGIPLYTAPPQREWVGLTDEEYEAMAEDHVTDCYFDTLEYAKAIEAKLKEKNT